MRAAEPTAKAAGMDRASILVTKQPSQPPAVHGLMDSTWSLNCTTSMAMPYLSAHFLTIPDWAP